MVVTAIDVPVNENPRDYIISYVISRICSHFVFGFYDMDDIRQECWVIALEAMGSPGYDDSRPLEKFLYSHLFNRLTNLFRNKYFRAEVPCECCSRETEFPCKKYRGWLSRNYSKKILFEKSPNPNQNMDISPDIDSGFSEILESLDSRMPADLRTDYLRLLSGVHISLTRKNRIKSIVMEILYGTPPQEDHPL